MRGQRLASGPRLAMALARAVDELADQQFGAVSRNQLLAMGATRSWIAARLRTQRWQRPFPGVYVVFTGPLPFPTRVAAALLRCGSGAMAWGLTAAALDGLADEPPEVVHILIPADRRLTVEPPINLRRARAADQRGHPVRTPARTRIEETVLDLCEQSATAVDVAAWVSRAVGRRLTTPARLRVALSARRRHRWRAALVELLADVEAGAQSPLELRYLRDVERAHALPRGEGQVRLVGRRVRWVDVDHAEFTTRVELDGRLGHIEEGRSGTGCGTTRPQSPVERRFATAGPTWSAVHAAWPLRWLRCCRRAAGPAGRAAAVQAADSGTDREASGSR